MLTSFVLMLHFILNLYILHKFVIRNKKGEEITISPLLPNFIIKYLERLKSFSQEVLVVKCVKDIYYRHLILYTIIFIWSIYVLLHIS